MNAIFKVNHAGTVATVSLITQPTDGPAKGMPVSTGTLFLRSISGTANRQYVFDESFLARLDPPTMPDLEHSYNGSGWFWKDIKLGKWFMVFESEPFGSAQMPESGASIQVVIQYNDATGPLAGTKYLTCAGTLELVA